MSEPTEPIESTPPTGFTPASAILGPTKPARLPQIPTYADVAIAAARLLDIAQETPVFTCGTAAARLGRHATAYFKAENLQRMGAFKFRGAYNTLVQLSPAQRKRGVIAYSSGNHAQAVALSAKLLGIPAVIVMPSDAPAAKMAATKGYGAEIVIYDRYTQDRQALTEQIAAERGGMVIVPPFNHPHVIAGQGTVALELLHDVPDLDYLFVPLGGGGLLSGTLLAVKHLAPNCKVYGVEPAAGNDGQQSLRAGRIVSIPTPQTIADGAQTTALGDITFQIIREHVTDIITATDEQIVDALRFYAERMKLIVEPTGALSLAGAQNSGIDFTDRKVGFIISGGNVDLPFYGRLVSEGTQPSITRTSSSSVVLSWESVETIEQR